MPTLLPLWRATRTTGKQCGLTATGDYQPSLRSPWLAANDGYHFADCVVRQIHGYDAGCSGLRSEILYGADLASDLRTSLASFFSVPIEASSWQISQALSRLFAERPTVVIVTPPGITPAGDLWQEAIAIKDEMAKSDFPSSPTFIFLDNSEHRLNGRRTFNFARGRPVFGVLDIPDWEDILLWKAYLHVRIAWEAGGDPLLADDIYAAINRGLAVGRDDSFEHELNNWASIYFSKLPKETIDLLSIYLAKGNESATRSRSDEKILEEAGIIWRPWGSRSFAPKPWLARALLCKDSRHTRCWLLRGALVCIPLSNEIPSRCQDLEQQLKASAVGKPARNGSDVPEKTYKLWERYQEGRDATTLYPQGHPSPPDRPEDAWIFASLGQFLVAPLSPLGRRYSKSEMTLSRLRNTLAHGHYVSWEHVKMIKEILQALSL